MKYCNNCGSTVEDNAAFCNYCGAVFETMDVNYNVQNETIDYNKTTVLGTGQVNNETNTYNNQYQYNTYQQEYQSGTLYQPEVQANNSQQPYQNAIVSQPILNNQQQYQNVYVAGNPAVAPKNGLFKSYSLFWKNYTNFSTRTRRSDFWQFILVNFLISLVAGALNFIPVVGSIISGVYLIALLIPSLALQIRRLHDIGKEWYSIFLALIPIAGFFILLVFYCRDSQLGENKFGLNPKELYQIQNEYQNY